MDVSELRDVSRGRSRRLPAANRPKPGSDAECEAVLQALQDSNHNVVRAARLLGVGRATFYRMLERHQIERGRYCHAPR
jgi:transcriptional regulator of acetoin/glycerol metabolism